MTLNNKQIDYIRDNHDDVLDEVINDEIDRVLIYTDDIWDILKENYDPMDLLNGTITIDDVLSDLHSVHYYDLDTYMEVYDRLDDEDQKEIDDLE